jgi:hypothetical protein
MQGETERALRGQAAAKLDGKAGFVSAAGKWLIGPKFDTQFRPGELKGDKSSQLLPASRNDVG